LQQTWDEIRCIDVGLVRVGLQAEVVLVADATSASEMTCRANSSTSLDTAAVLDLLAHNSSPFSVGFSLPSAANPIQDAALRLNRTNTVFVNLDHS